MVFRIFGDNLKAYLRGLGLIEATGNYTTSCFLLFVVYSFVVMRYISCNIFGYGLCLALYELSSLTCGLYYYINVIDKRARNTSMTTFRNFWWIIKESLKATVPNILTWIIADLTIVILTWMHSEVQLAAFANIIVIQKTFFGIDKGFETVLIKNINTYLARK